MRRVGTMRIGVDIGGTKIAVGVISDDGSVLRRERVPTPHSGGADVMAAVCELVRGMIPGAETLTGIGIGAPGIIDRLSGRVRSATDVLPGWADTDIAGPVRAATGLPVAVENDVRAAALGEARHGAGAGINRLLVVSLGTGVGGALVIGGHLQRGTHGTAGEIAHLLVPGRGPVACGCGRFDHLESQASGPAIAAGYRRAVSYAGGGQGVPDRHTGGSHSDAPAPAAEASPSLPAVVARWRSGDPLAEQVITGAAALAGRAIAGLAGALDIDGVVITGGVAAIGDGILAPLRAAFREAVIRPLRDIPVILGQLGADAPLVGAAGLAPPDDGGCASATKARWTAAAFAEAIRGELVVSCQAPDGHPMRDTATIVRLARAAETGGAAAIRCGGYGGLADVAAVAAAVELPVIGLTKEGTEGVYITPTLSSAIAVAGAGAAAVAVDATGRPRPDGSTLAEVVAAVHAAGALTMADVSSVAEGIAAARAGADLISTTLAGYTAASPVPPGPDIVLVAGLRRALPSAVITAEGRYRTPTEAAGAIRAGADAVIVGTAVTDPAWIAAQFAAEVRAAMG